jgi:hypothetical protein
METKLQGQIDALTDDRIVPYRAVISLVDAQAMTKEQAVGFLDHIADLRDDEFGAKISNLCTSWYYARHQAQAFDEIRRLICNPSNSEEEVDSHEAAGV